MQLANTSNIRIGTCGYSYPGPPPRGWSGVFYPLKKGRGFDELEYYSRFFNTVEVNSTFYRPPAPAMAAAWAEKSPEDFEFTVKVWQKFTHLKKIRADSTSGETWEKPTDADVKEFKSGIAPLLAAKKLTLLVFQYPAGFHCSKENVERLQWALTAFSGYEKVVELRHRSWSERRDEIEALFTELGASWVVADEPKFHTSVRQDFAPIGAIFYLRLHGRNWQNWWNHGESWERYDYLYTPEQIRSLGERIVRSAAQSPDKRIYVLFNNHARGQAVANGLMLQHELGQEMNQPLPATLVQAYPDLAAFAPAEPRDTLF